MNGTGPINNKAKPPRKCPRAEKLSGSIFDCKQREKEPFI